MHTTPLPSIPFIQPGDKVVLRRYTVKHTLGGEVVEVIVSLRHSLAEARTVARDSAESIKAADALARKRYAFDVGMATITCIGEGLAVAR